MDVVELEKDSCGVGTGGVAVPLAEEGRSESFPRVFDRLRLKMLLKGDLLDFLSVAAGTLLGIGRLSLSPAGRDAADVGV